MSRDIETRAKILLVDNVSENLQVLGYILDKAGFETSFAVTSRQAMEFVSIEKPDLILLDINLPDFDGYQLCKTFHLDEETSHIPVIFLTSNAGKEEIVTGLISLGNSISLF